jgi:hypothetical protein
MSSELLKKTANVLEMLATQMDHEETAREKVAQDERIKFARDLGEKYTTATGEELPEEVLLKIATTDANMLDAFTSLMDKRSNFIDNDSVDDMGEDVGGPDNAEVVSMTKSAQLKHAADQAGDNLVDWCLK